MKPMVVASTRPELIKLSPVMRALDGEGLDYPFITTGQHYDRSLFQGFIEDLELKKPEYDIKVGSGSQAYQTSFAMVELEKIMEKERPSVVIVEGDTNSVLSASLAAVKLHIPVAHVEAGLRSFDRTMPEEINRILADHCSEVLFAPTEKAGLNLINEGIPPEKIFIVGNTIVDATVQNLEIAKEKSEIAERYPKDYLVLTLHRAENVDKRGRLKGIVEALRRIGEDIIFPVHPRTKKMLETSGLGEDLDNITLVEPMGYLDFLLLMSRAKAILTDSGGIQEEAIILKVPCITLRTTTERPETIEAGGNILAGVETEGILEKAKLVLENQEVYRRMRSAENPFGDGRTGERIVKILLKLYEEKKLKVESQDFTSGFWERKFMTVDSSLEGKRIADLGFTVFKVIEDEKERFPRKEMVLKKGQVLEVRL